MEETALFDLAPNTDSWHSRRRVGFDLETTSRYPQQARIVSAALVIVEEDDDAAGGPAPSEGEQIGGLRRISEWLVDPGVEIPAETTAVHGISTEYVREQGQPAEEAVPELVAALTREFESGSAVVVMNAPYDLTVLRAEAARYGVEFPEPRTVIDPLVLDKQVDKYRRGKRRLSDLCGVYEVLLEEAHSATADAWAAVQVTDCLAERYPQLQIPAQELHALQVGWKAEQAEQLQEFMRRTRPDVVISPAWPLP